MNLLSTTLLLFNTNNIQSVKLILQFVLISILVLQYIINVREHFTTAADTAGGDAEQPPPSSEKNRV
jgi:hypothetical protein